jgi:hypothetical protein
LTPRGVLLAALAISGVVLADVFQQLLQWRKRVLDAIGLRVDARSLTRPGRQPDRPSSPWRVHPPVHAILLFAMLCRGGPAVVVLRPQVHATYSCAWHATPSGPGSSPLSARSNRSTLAALAGLAPRYQAAGAWFILKS